MIRLGTPILPGIYSIQCPIEMEFGRVRSEVSVVEERAA
jgi:hypothetical protein